ncbi:hypothetical protein [Mycolicibacterium agri]|uniref:hypothetical protein n=1 Tax=Mycolicibacterium agri TaxID=36811 RepID=UPI001F2913EF|nr:hypothetical protein [Mycolicibacterium agri]
MTATISIEHDTNIALSEDVCPLPRLRLARAGDRGRENVVAIEQAIVEAKKVTDKPSFIRSARSSAIPPRPR